MRVHLLRHLPVCLPEGVCYGASDVDSLAATDADLAPIRALLMASPTLLVSSPMRRCRVLAALSDALDEARRLDLSQLLIVTHGGPIRVMRGHLLALPQTGWLDWTCAPGAVFSLQQRADGGWCRWAH